MKNMGEYATHCCRCASMDCLDCKKVAAVKVDMWLEGEYLGYQHLCDDCVRVHRGRRDARISKI